MRQSEKTFQLLNKLISFGFRLIPSALKLSKYPVADLRPVNKHTVSSSLEGTNLQTNSRRAKKQTAMSGRIDSFDRRDMDGGGRARKVGGADT